MTKQKKQLLLWRILLGILVICNMAVIFLFSSQSAAKSAALSQKIVVGIVELLPTKKPSQKVEKPSETITAPPEETTKNPDENSSSDENKIDKNDENSSAKPEKELTQEQAALVQKMHTPIRKLAHLLEFGSLATLCFLFLITWKGKLWWRYVASLGFSLVYAVTDEFHQFFEEGRGAMLTDIAIDFVGSFIACTSAFIIVVLIRRRGRLVTTHYTLPILPDGKAFDVAVVSDLHDCAYTELLQRLRDASPNIILLPGDLTEAEKLTNESSDVYAFLRACAEIAPTYYALGNHETIGSRKVRTWCQNGVPVEIREKIEQTGVKLLHNESVLWNGIRICGLSSGLTKTTNAPNEVALAEFAAAKELRILLCHHPEYYEPYVRATNIELTVSGHAHGGQWHFFGHGVFAPGQGILPKYTSGVIDNRLVISRGAGDHTWIPRIANPREVVIIHVTQKNQNNNL